MQYLPPQSFPVFPFRRSGNPRSENLNSSDPSSKDLKAPRALAAAGWFPCRSDSGAFGGDGSAPGPGAASAPDSPEALTQDARNLLTALGLYADLLNAPGVLSQRHRHYGSELRLLADGGSALLGRVLPSCMAADPGGEARRPARQVSPGEPWALPTNRAEKYGEANGEAPRQGASRSAEPLCDPETVLRRFLPVLQAQTAGAVRLVLRLPRETPPLPLSGEALERIVGHLAGHAAEAVRSVAGGESSRASAAAAAGLGPLKTVWIGLAVRDGVARLSVEDSGPGRCAPVAAGSPQSDAGAPYAGGGSAGQARELGHGIVHGLVAETGGRLAIRPRPGAGTVVTVRWVLPADSTLRFYPPEPAGMYGRVGKVVIAC